MSTQDEFGELRDNEVQVPASKELLWRQIHPAFLDGGQVSSQAFAPSDKDDGELSVNRQSIVSATEAFQHFTEVQRFQSAAVYAVSVEEVAAKGLRTVDDSTSDPENAPSPGHAYIDFKAVAANKRRKKIGGLLRDQAVARGQQHP
ncbi:hypothetical protein ACFYUY_05130 [Kitasatospora sp. NPDC004745]|uniref:hypothetical protein n=1 Tax=Kitasatospora sp. NPDC004745 TaxID=3364019 RepID=UPI0036A59430